MTEPAGPGPHQQPGEREPAVSSVERTERGIVVTLAGELDLYNADALRSALFACCAEEPERLVVDLERVRFIDSTALGVLIEARSKLPNRRGFMLAAPRLATRRALEVSGLDRHFSLHDTTGEALAAPV